MRFIPEDKPPHFPKPAIMQTCPIDFEECKKKEEIEKEFNPSQVFLDIPYSGYNKEYEIAIKNTVENFGLTPVLAETRAKAEGLLCNVCKTIQKSGYAVVDISDHNANVLYELGIIHTLGKKGCILCDSVTKIPVDLGGLIINKYQDKKEIEKDVSKWIADNVEEVTIKIAKQKKILDIIFYQLENNESEHLLSRIKEIKEIGVFITLKNEYKRIAKFLLDFHTYDELSNQFKKDCLEEICDIAIEPLINDSKDDDQELQNEAIILLGYTRDSRAIDVLVMALEDEKSNIRGCAVNSLRKIGDKKAVEPLIEALNDDNPEVRVNVANALGMLGDKKAVEPLIAVLNDDNPEVRVNVANALGMLGDKKAVEPLIAVLNDDNPEVRVNVANAFGMLGDKKAVEPLIAVLNDDNPEVRVNIVRVLGMIGGKRAVEPLIAILNDDYLPTLNQTVLSLGYIGDKRAVEPLIAILKDEKMGVRLDVITALGEIGDIRAIKPLSALSHGENEWVREHVHNIIIKIRCSQKDRAEE